MPRRNILNVRDHLDHVQLILSSLQENQPIPPVLWDEITRARFIGKHILRKADERRSRHDLYIGAQK